MHQARLWGVLFVCSLALALMGCTQKPQESSPPAAPAQGPSQSPPAGKAAKGPDMAMKGMPMGPIGKGGAGGPGGDPNNPLAGFPPGTSSDSPLAGQKAPDFTLPGDDGKKVSLKELLKKGPVMVYFYKGDW